jgi:hypothetical protein
METTPTLTETQKLLNKYELALTHLTNLTMDFEARFDTEPFLISYETMEEYCQAAKFLKSTGRQFSRITEVENEMLRREAL